MALEVFQGASIPRELSSAALEYLWAKWKTLSSTKSLSLQRLTEESNYQFRPNLVELMPVGDDFVPMYIGQAIQDALGFNPTGRPLSDSTAAVTRDLLELYRHTAKTFMPSFVRMTGPPPHGDIWQGLALPIRLAADVTMIVCYFEQVSPQREVYEYLFQHSPEAMIVASPIVNDVGNALDGWVVMINEAGRKLLRFRGAIGNLRLKHLPQLEALDLSFKLHPPVAPGTSVRTVHGAQFDVEMIRFARVFTLVMRPPRGLERQPGAEIPTLVPVL